VRLLITRSDRGNSHSTIRAHCITSLSIMVRVGSGLGLFIRQDSDDTALKISVDIDDTPDLLLLIQHNCPSCNTGTVVFPFIMVTVSFYLIINRLIITKNSA